MAKRFEDNEGGIAVEPEPNDGSEAPTHALPSAEDIESPERAERIEYELSRSRVFGYIEPLRRKVKELAKSVKQIEDADLVGDEEEYEKRLTALNEKKELLNNVTIFENKLWGESPEEHELSVAELNNDIASIETLDGVLTFFDKWKALPGANPHDRPIADRKTVEGFLNLCYESKDSEHVREVAQKLITNIALREKVLKAVPNIEISPEVADYEDEEEVPVVVKNKTVKRDPGVFSPRLAEERERREAEPTEAEYVSEISERREKIVAAEKDRNEKEVLQNEAALRIAEQGLLRKRNEKEAVLDNVIEQENALVDAKEIISSKMFRFSPFLMKLTKGGREKLAILKKAGLDEKTIRTAGGNLELARALRLKAVQEKGRAITGVVKQAFAHDLETRKLSEEREKAIAQVRPVTRTEYYDDQKDLKEKKTGRKKSLSNIKGGLKRLSK